MPNLFRLLAPRAAPPAPRAIERDVVQLQLEDGSQVDVLRVRDPRARRLRLSVDERGARLTLPGRASKLSGERFLDEHRAWLALQLAQYADVALAPLQAGVTTSLPLRGEPWPLHWQAGRYARVRRDDAAVHFAHPPTVRDTALRRALRDFYESEARADVGRWLPRYLEGLPRPPRRVLFKQMSSQWGSLAPDGSLALDLSLVLARPSAFEYVLVHELCHLLHADHSRAFWSQVEQRCPAWRDERAYFHAHGRRLKASLRALLASSD